jgi:predicted phosphodiesterase
LKYLIFADLHANKYGIKNILAFFKENGIDKMYCLGDIVGYNSYPNECVAFIKNNNIDSIKGNHECLVLDELSLSTCRSERSQNAIGVTKKILSEENRAFLKKMPDELQITQNSIGIHAGFSSVYETVNTIDKAKKNFDVLRQRGEKIAFFGHTHRPGSYVYNLKKESVTTFPIEKTLLIKEDELYLINPGTCGEPRHGLPLSFIVYDDVAGEVSFQVFDLSDENIADLKANNKRVFGTTSLKRFPRQVHEKTRKLYYKIGKIKDNFSQSIVL